MWLAAALLLTTGAGYHLVRRAAVTTTKTSAGATSDPGTGAPFEDEPARGGIGLIDSRPTDDEEVEPGASDAIDDSPEEESGERPRRGRRIHHVTGAHRVVHTLSGRFEYDFEDEWIHGDVPDEWEGCDEDDCDGEEDRRGGALMPRAATAPGPTSWCAGNLLCVIASAAGGGPAPSLPEAGGAAYRRAREDFRAGRFRDAAAGFVLTAATAPAPAAPAAADRELICNQAAAALLAAASGDGARDAPSPSTDEPTMLASLGPCAPQVHRMLAPAGPLPPSSTAGQAPGGEPAEPPPDITHL